MSGLRFFLLLPPELQGFLFQMLVHVSELTAASTNVSRFQGILRSAAILPDPEIPDSERWSTSLGSKWYPYVRTLGGISLFDFRRFNRQQ
jgi:hypothetical protein